MTWNIRGAQHPNLELSRRGRSRATHPTWSRCRRCNVARRAGWRSRLGWQQQWARKHYPYSPLVWWRAEGIAHPLAAADVATSCAPPSRPGVSTWIYRHRVLLAATVTRADGALRVYDTHLSSATTPTSASRRPRAWPSACVQDAAPRSRGRRRPEHAPTTRSRSSASSTPSACATPAATVTQPVDRARTSDSTTCWCPTHATRHRSRTPPRAATVGGAQRPPPRARRSSRPDRPRAARCAPSSGAAPSR